MKRETTTNDNGTREGTMKATATVSTTKYGDTAIEIKCDAGTFKAVQECKMGRTQNIWTDKWEMEMSLISDDYLREVVAGLGIDAEIEAAIAQRVVRTEERK